MPHKINLSIGEQVFFSQKFFICLKFLKNGMINGTLTHFPATLKFQKPFSGLYTEKTSRLKLTFFIEWANPNLNSKALTCFSGEIFNYEDNSKCLVLRWLQINKSSTRIGSFIHTDLEILIDNEKRDMNREIEKIVPLIHKK